MKQFLIVLAVLVLIGAAVTGTSYAAGSKAIAEFVGSEQAEEALGHRKVRFALLGVAELPDSPRVWVFHYPSTDLVRLLEVTIYVTPKGKILSTDPHNLEQRLLGYRSADSAR
ncbi:MAG: hypothetical protein O7I93_08605 [Gemmatimonadetes bacterium]|nr:hypothetical protein [Gemmatimonadota bacterium]